MTSAEKRLWEENLLNLNLSSDAEWQSATEEKASFGWNDRWCATLTAHEICVKTDVESKSNEMEWNSFSIKSCSNNL